MINESNYSHVVPRKLLVVQLIRLGERRRGQDRARPSSVPETSERIDCTVHQTDLSDSEVRQSLEVGNDAVN